MDEVKVIEVIYCTKKRNGKGVELDPIRCVTEIFDFEGKLIAENDPAKIFTQKEMASFALFVAKADWTKIDILELFRQWKITEGMKGLPF